MKTLEEKYIKIIQDFYKKHGRIPKRRELNNYSSMFRKVFGSWNNAIKAAGYEPNTRHLPSKEILIKSLYDFAHKHNRPPKASEANSKNKLHDAKSYMKVFGVKTWGEVLEYAGLKAYFHVSKITKNAEKAKEEIIKFIQEKNIKTTEEYKRLDPRHLPSITYISENYGWKNLIIEAGIIEELSIENITSKTLQFHKENGHTPSISELSDLLKASPRAITNITGTYVIFVKSLGLRPKNNTPKTNNLSESELIKLYKTKSLEFGYENGLPERLIREATGVGSDVFASRFTSLYNLRMLCGFKSKPQKTIYTKEEITNNLHKFRKELGRIPTHKEISENKDLPALSTIFRYLQVTSLKEFWNKKNEIK